MSCGVAACKLHAWYGTHAPVWMFRSVLHHICPSALPCSHHSRGVRHPDRAAARLAAAVVGGRGGGAAGRRRRRRGGSGRRELNGGPTAGSARQDWILARLPAILCNREHAAQHAQRPTTWAPGQLQSSRCRLAALWAPSFQTLLASGSALPLPGCTNGTRWEPSARPDCAPAPPCSPCATVATPGSLQARSRGR